MALATINRSQLQRIAILVPLFAAVAWGSGWLLAVKDMETLRAGVILSLLAGGSLVLFWLASRSDPDGRLLLGLLWTSLVLKFLVVYMRFVVPGMLVDARTYSREGREIARLLASGVWPEMTQFWGTSFVRLLTGLFYFAAGPTFYGISILWAWLAMVGMLLFYKAFRTAFPSGNHRLYMALIFLFPSVLLWTSSLGKDALMLFFGGLATYGLARTRWRFELLGILPLALGAAGMLAVRPHIAAAYVAAAALGIGMRPLGGGSGAAFLRLLTIMIVLAVAIGVAVTASSQVGLETLEAEEVLEFIGERQERTGARGGSAFQPIDTSSPLGLALLVPTVLFRPFPFEAHNFNALLASLEGLALMAIIVARFRSVRAAILGTVRDNFLLATVVYAMMFFYMYSAVANFGIIARQRVQIFPFVFMWVAYLGSTRTGGASSSR